MDGELRWEATSPKLLNTGPQRMHSLFSQTRTILSFDYHFRTRSIFDHAYLEGFPSRIARLQFNAFLFQLHVVKVLDLVWSDRLYLQWYIYLRSMLELLFLYASSASLSNSVFHPWCRVCHLQASTESSVSADFLSLLPVVRLALYQENLWWVVLFLFPLCRPTSLMFSARFHCVITKKDVLKVIRIMISARFSFIETTQAAHPCQNGAGWSQWTNPIPLASSVEQPTDIWYASVVYWGFHLQFLIVVYLAPAFNASATSWWWPCLRGLKLRSVVLLLSPVPWRATVIPPFPQKFEDYESSFNWVSDSRVPLHF